MQIRLRSTGQVMYWEEFRNLLISQNPSMLIKVAGEDANWINQNGADIVFDGPYPTHTQYQVVSSGPTVQENGQWYTSYVVTDMDDAAKAIVDAEQAKNIRNKRDSKLTACDWTQIADCPITNKADWATYRQALRDLPKESGFPWTFNWPTNPNGDK